ncbi:serine hydrolase [Flavobacterium dauae]|uniref:serine hydrolase domain-containing protein n=1 Tax=Flavobacterium dauae TaxID=1563479 RepID=UPI00101B3DF6|nr:serine hydrolase [Flavobacterium dauae]WLD24264.1 serine hydrolase [Flavobacterium dauae]
MKKLFLFVWLTLSLSNSVVAQKQQERLDSLFTALKNKNAFNGNVLIADKGKIIFEKSYGLANIKEDIKLTEKSVFNLASVTKQFTAAGILLLEGENKLSLSDDITKYIPELSFYKGVKIEHLIHHTSGLPDYMELLNQKADKNVVVTNDYIIQLFAKEKPELLFKPNDQFEYSNTGYLFLATIIERVSNISYSNYLKQKIFSPLNMSNTNVFFLYKDNLTIPDLAIGYVQEGVGEELISNIPYVKYFDGAYGQGRIYSTTKDLLKWAESIKNNTLFTKEQTNIITDNFKLNNDENTNYGFGLFVGKNKNYGKIINHSGGWGGYTTFLEQHFSSDKILIILQNHSLITTKIPIQQVRKILYNEPLKSDMPIELNTNDLDKYLGNYMNIDISMKISITKKGNILYSQATDQMEIPMDAYENNVFKFEPADIVLTFNLEEKNFELSQGGIKFVFRKE